MKVRTAVLAMSCALAVGACSTSAEKRAKAHEDLQELRERIEARAQKRENTRKEEFIKEVPAWAMETPPADGTGVYAVGAGESDKMTTALRIAELQAQYGLASQLDAELSGSERVFEEDRGAGRPVTRYRQLIDKLVAEVPVVGVETLEKEVKPLQGKFHAFVLLKMPYEAFNKVLQAKRSESADTSVERAFKDLERRLAERRERKGLAAPLDANAFVVKEGSGAGEPSEIEELGPGLTVR